MLITTTQLQYYIDQRLIGEFLQDADTGVPVPSNQFATNPTLLALMEAASQELIAACFRANMYTVNEIVSLAGDQVGGMLPTALPGTTTVAQSPANLLPITQTNAIVIPGIGEDLRRTVAALVFGPLLDRRKMAIEDYTKLLGAYNNAQAKLQQITQGERIWQVPGAALAGLPSVAVLGQNSGPFAINRQVGLWGNQALPYGGCYGDYEGGSFGGIW
jgi:hypothetical protein